MICYQVTKTSHVKSSIEKYFQENSGICFSAEVVLIKFQRLRREKFFRHHFFYPSGNGALNNPALITNQEAHMTNGNIEKGNTDKVKSKRKSNTITNYFSKNSSAGS